MTEDQQKDFFIHALDSSQQALIEVVRNMQQEWQKHREEEIKSREEYRKSLVSDVKSEMQAGFNGKVDKIMLILKTLQERSEPALKQYEDTKTTWSTIKKWSLQVGIIAALITGARALLNALSK